MKSVLYRKPDTKEYVQIILPDSARFFPDGAIVPLLPKGARAEILHYENVGYCGEYEETDIVATPKFLWHPKVTYVKREPNKALRKIKKKQKQQGNDIYNLYEDQYDSDKCIGNIESKVKELEGQHAQIQSLEKRMERLEQQLNTMFGESRNGS